MKAFCFILLILYMFTIILSTNYKINTKKIW